MTKLLFFIIAVGAVLYVVIQKAEDQPVSPQFLTPPLSNQNPQSAPEISLPSDTPIPEPQTPTSPREAADAYIKELEERGTVFGSGFQKIIIYSLSPQQDEVIYTLDYVNQDGVRLTAPYTITVEKIGEGWKAIGGTPGDRTADLNTNPVIGKDGVYRTSPLEQQIGAAMNKGSSDTNTGHSGLTSEKDWDKMFPKHPPQ